MGGVVVWGATERQYRVECIDPPTGEEIDTLIKAASRIGV